MDPLSILGLKIAVGNVLKTAVGDGAKDIVKDFFKDSIHRVASTAQSSTLEKALSRSLQQYVDLFQKEIEHTGDFSFLREYFESALIIFVKHPEVRRILGSPFDISVRVLDTPGLRRLWSDLGLPGLPDTFEWYVLSATYLREVRRTLREDSDLQAILNADNINRTRETLESLVGVEARFDLVGYANAIMKLYDRLRLDTLDISGQDYGVRLRKVFVPQDVREGIPYYDLPKDLLKRLQSQGTIEDETNLDEWEDLRRRYLSSPLMSIDAVLADGNCKSFVVLGDPGSGKSSLAQSVLLKWVESPNQPLPILIELRGYTQDVGNPRSFLQYLESGEGCMWRFRQLDLDEWLRTRSTFVIFEGLDEVFDPIRRHETTRAILRFATEYPEARLMVTSRSVGYQSQEMRNGGFRHFTLQDFSDEQVERFLGSWHDAAIAGPADRVILAARLRESLSESSSLRELAGNPLLLTMLAMLNRNQELPRDRADAYNQMSRVLLHQWDVNKFLREHGGTLGERIGRHEKEEILRRIAVEIQTSLGMATNLIIRQRLESVIAEYLRDVLHLEQAEAGARLMIQQLRVRNFVLCQAGADYLAFVHRTFLEYFCASAFVNRFLATLSIEQLQQETFRVHWREESWTEVLKLIVGMVPEAHAARLIEGLLELENHERDFENVFLAAACWREMGESGRTDIARRKLWRQLIGAADFKPAGLSFPVDNLGTVIPRRESRIMWTQTIKTRAVTMIGKTFAGDPEALTWLYECMAHRKSWGMRQAAVRALANGWAGLPEVGVWLRWAARPEEDQNVRITSVRETARGWKKDPETIGWLKMLADSEDAGDVRGAAIQEIVRGWSRDEGTSAFLASLGRDPF